MDDEFEDVTRKTGHRRPLLASSVVGLSRAGLVILYKANRCWDSRRNKIKSLDNQQNHYEAMKMVNRR